MQKMSLQAAYETDIHHFSLLCLPLRKPRPLLCGFILIAKELTAEGMPEDSTEGRREIRSETRLQSPHFPQPSIEKALFAFVCDQRERGVRVKFAGGKKSVIDGPFAETKELVAGFWLWQCKSLDEAIEWLKRAPFEETEVEIRQLFEAEDFGAEFTPELREQEARIREQVETQRKS